MRKVIKILLSVFSYLLLALIGLPFLFVISLYFTPVQNFLCDAAAKLLSKKLGTTVSIGYINFRPFNNLVINDIYMEDLQGDTLIYVAKFGASIENTGLISGDFALGQITLADGQLNLREVKPGLLNISEVFERLQSKDKEKKPGGVFKLTAREFDIRGLDFSMAMLEKRPSDGSIDFKDMEVHNLTFKGSGVRIKNDSISLVSSSLSFSEKSGFELSALMFDDFTISGTGMRFHGMNILVPDSKLRFERLYMLYDSWAAYKNFTNEVRFDAVINDSQLDFVTLGYFAPALKNWDLAFDKLSANMSGPVSSMHGSIYEARTPGGTGVRAVYSIIGVPDMAKARFNIDLKELSANGADLRRIMSSIAGPSMDGALTMVERVAPIRLSAQFDGMLNSFSAAAAVTTAGGNAKATVKMKPEGKGSAFSGEVSADKLNLKLLTANKQLGTLTASVKASGTMHGKSLDMKADADVEEIGFNDYVYHGVKLLGKVDNRSYRGLVNSNDPNARFAAGGLFDFGDTIPRYDARIRLAHVDLGALNFNKRDSVSVIACDIEAKASGADLETLNGVIRLKNLNYTSRTDSIRNGSATITSVSVPGGSKQLTLNSNAFDAEFRSPLPYGQFFSYLLNAVSYYVPTTGRIDHRLPKEEAEGKSFIMVDIKEANNLAGALMPGLKVSSGTKLQLELNHSTEDISIAVRSDSIRLNTLSASGLDMTTKTVNDSMLLAVAITEFSVGTLRLPQVAINGGAKSGKLDLSVGYTDKQNNTSAHLGIKGGSVRNPDTGVPGVEVTISPSRFVNRSRIWDISAGKIFYDSTRVDINRFLIASNGERLSADGTLSRSRSDSLRVDLQNFDLTPLSKMLAKNDDYRLDKGRLTGYANIVSGLRQAIVYADLSLDSVAVNSIAVPDTHIRSLWDGVNQRVRASVTKKIDGDTLIRAFYRPSDKRYMADLRLAGIDLSLADPALSGLVDNTTGSADIRARIAGVGANPEINGSVELHDVGTKVDFTNVTYKIDQAYISIKDNIFTLAPATVTDPAGHVGLVEMSLSLANLRNMSYEVKVNPENLMVLDTSPNNNELFYGRVYVTGKATLIGDNSGVKIDASMTTNDNSNFTLALSSKSDFARADFVVFRSRSESEQLKSGNGGNREIGRRNNVSVTLALDVQPNTDLHVIIDPSTGDGIRATGRGMMNFAINPARDQMDMVGEYVISTGSYALTLENIISRKFDIRNGSSITFNGNPLDAEVDVTAVYTTKASLDPILGDDRNHMKVAVDCELMLDGKLSNPKITFNVTVPGGDTETRNSIANALATQEMMATQFVWLLATNSFYADGQADSNLNIGTAGMAAAGTGLLTNYLLSMIPTGDRLDIGVKYTPKMGDGTSDEVNINAQAAIDKDGRLTLDAEGTYDSQRRMNSTSNWSGDFYLTWKINKSGNLRAKVFTRTIDRFDENQGLQESGVGIYYGRDFNKFSDLVRRKKKKAQPKEEADSTKTTTNAN